MTLCSSRAAKPWLTFVSPDHLPRFRAGLCLEPRDLRPVVLRPRICAARAAPGPGARDPPQRRRDQEDASAINRRTDKRTNETTRTARNGMSRYGCTSCHRAATGSFIDRSPLISADIPRREHRSLTQFVNNGEQERERERVIFIYSTGGCWILGISYCSHGAACIARGGLASSTSLFGCPLFSGLGRGVSGGSGVW